jgi:hypothetical protein
MNPANGAPSRRCFQPCARRKNLPLTLPVTALRSRNSRAPPGPLPSPLRQKKRLSRPEAPSTDELPARCAAFTTRLEREPATVPWTLPSRTGFRRSFALRYDEEGLDFAASASSSLAGVRCHAPLVDFCNRNEPQARPANRWNPVLCARTTNFRPLRDPQEGSPLLSERRSRVVTGQGPIRLWLSPLPAAPPGALARAESFAPTRLARTPPVAGSRCRWPEGPAQSLEPTQRPAFAFAKIDRPRDALSLRHRAGPPPAHFREETRVPPHPRCLPLSNLPSGEGLFSTRCPQPVEWGPGAFAIFAHSLSSTNDEGE